MLRDLRNKFKDMVLQSNIVPKRIDKSKIPLTYEYYYTLHYIKEHILTANQSKEFIKELATLLKKSPRRVEQLVYQKKDKEQYDMKGRQLKKIADHLQIPVDDLYTDIKEVRL